MVVSICNRTEQFSSWNFRKLLNQGKIDVKGEYGGGVEVEWYGKINDFSNTGVIYGEFYAVSMNGHL